MFQRIVMSTIVAGVLAAAGLAHADTIIDEWSKVQPPPAPVLKPATVTPKTTALLVMDLLKQSCSEQRRPRCVASLPKIKGLIEAAKAHGVTVIWTMYPGAKSEDYWPAVAPPAGTNFLVANADKFINTDLEKMLKDKGVTTLITVGTAATAADLLTPAHAAQLGFNVVVPVEGDTDSTAYDEQAAIYILATASTVSQHVTLTSIDTITYQ